MKLRLGFSTCPNDTFIFDAMVHHKIDTEGLEFDPLLADVEVLNKKAFEHTIDITKISYHAYAYLAKNYQLLDHGSALGRKNGPILISKSRVYHEEIPSLSVAIPGRYTTANLLLSIAFPELKRKTEFVFSDIEEAVNNREIDAGLIIHENRFTYEDKDLRKVLDLGEYWEQTTQMPIPLGGIIVNRKLPEDIKLKINRVLKRSIEYACSNPKESLEFVKKHAQEMDEEVMYKHIDLYVNDYTKELGEQGRAAIRKLYAVAHEKGVLSEIEEDIFL